MRSGGACVAAVMAILVVAITSSAATTVSCKRTYPDLDRVYNRLVLVYSYRGVSCSQGAMIGDAVADRYERGLPTVDYPPPPTGVPGGKGHSFDVATVIGSFTCKMTARGSDFVDATCERGSASVRIESLNHDYLAHPSPRPQTTPRIPVYGGVPSQADFQRRPFHVIYSGDGAALLAGRGSTRNRLHWTSWNASGGRAWGADWRDNCVPDCAEGTFFAFRANIHVYRPREVGGYLLFTRMSVTYTGQRPPGDSHQTILFGLSYDAQYDTYYLNTI